MVASQALQTLRRRWLGVAVWAGAVWLGTAVFLSQPGVAAEWPYVWHWTAVSAPVLVYELWILWRGLPQNHRAGETAVLPRLGLGNSLTLWRGLALALMAGFLLSPWPRGALGWLPALLYTAAGIIDYLDGYAARVMHQATRLGERLDMEYDGLGMLVVVLLAVWYGQLPGWFVPLGLARYLYVWGMWWRQRQGWPVTDIHPSVHRRIFAGFQMGFMSVVLWPILPADGLTLAGLIFGGGLTLSFGRDWLVTCGWLRADMPRYRQARRLAYHIFGVWLPVGIRPLLVITLLWLLLRAGTTPPPAWADLLVAWHLPPGLAWFLWGVALLATPAILLGAMARLAALLLILPLAADILTAGLAGLNGSLLLMGLYILLLGSGRLTLWRPEDGFLTRRLGVPRSELAGATRSRRFPWHWLLWLAAMVLLGWVWRTAPLREAWAILRRLTPGQVVTLMAVNGWILLWLNGRWWLILRALGYTVPYLTLAGYRLAAFGVTYFTPGPQFGGEPVQVFLVQQGHGVPGTTAVAAVVLDKLVELLVNFLFVSLGVTLVVWQQMFPGVLGWETAVLSLLLLAGPVLFLGLTWGGWYPADRGLRLVDRLVGWSGWQRWSRVTAVYTRGAQVIRDSEQQATRFCQENPRALLAALAVSLITWGWMVAEYWLMLRFIGLPVTTGQTIALLTVARVAYLLPIPAGLGVLEAGQVWALQALGLEPAAGLTVSLLIRARDVTLGLIGLGWGSHRWWQPDRSTHSTLNS